MTITIDDIHLPLEVERGMIGGPEFYTTILTTPNAVKSTIMHRQQALHRWELSVIGMRDDNIEAMRTFFYGRRGPAYGFLFKDWAGGYTMAKQDIATADGVETDFPLYKTYGDAIRPYVRYITRPILVGTGALVVYVDDVVSNPVGWDFEDGYIKFAVAPADEAVISAECQFDVPVHFLGDQLVYQMMHSTQAIMPQFTLEEINEFMQLAA